MNMFHWRELGLEYLVQAAFNDRLSLLNEKWSLALTTFSLLNTLNVRLRLPFYDTLCQCWQQLSETHITTHNYRQPGLKEHGD